MTITPIWKRLQSRLEIAVVRHWVIDKHVVKYDTPEESSVTDTNQYTACAILKDVDGSFVKAIVFHDWEMPLFTITCMICAEYWQTWLSVAEHTARPSWSRFVNGTPTQILIWGGMKL